jgi:CheY-like chemotaxis protein
MDQLSSSMLRRVSAPRPRERRLLVVDDIEENRVLLRRFFGNRGFRIEQADSGAAALALIGKQSFDAVLLDIVMPEMDGMEVLKRIRTMYPKSELPVIMVTAKSANAYIALALELGANDYITKPVDFSAAFTCVQNILLPIRDEQLTMPASEAAIDAQYGGREHAARLLTLATRLRQEGHFDYAEQLTAMAAKYLE